MNRQKLAAVAALSIICAACSTPATRQAAPERSTAPATTGASSTKAAPRTVKSRDGSFEGEIVGTPAPDSRFARLQIGMQMDEIQTVMGRSPDRSHGYESGKRWIPFYFGSDATRMQALYKGEGCLILTGGNVFGGGGGTLIQIEADPSGACYQP